MIETRGVDNVTAEELIEEVTPYAKASKVVVCVYSRSEPKAGFPPIFFSSRKKEHVSEEVKNALLSMIREAMTNSLVS